VCLPSGVRGTPIPVKDLPARDLKGLGRVRRVANVFRLF